MTTRPLLTLSLLALLASSATADRTEHYAERVEAFRAANAALDPAKRHVVLVGDSLTEGWEQRDRVRKFLPSLADRVLNRGIGADGASP